MKSKLFGVGINDAGYPTRVREELPSISGKRRQKLVWTCPYFQTWRNMLARAYSPSVQKDRKTYIDVSVCEDWLTFSNFKSWMEKQDWEGKQLDKDLLSADRKIYSPETCVFLSAELNTFLSVKTTKTSELPVGVHRYRNGRFVAQCHFEESGKRFLGYFDTAEDAHLEWLKHKRLKVRQLIDKETDPLIIAALCAKFQVNPLDYDT